MGRIGGRGGAFFVVHPAFVVLPGSVNLGYGFQGMGPPPYALHLVRDVGLDPLNAAGLSVDIVGTHPKNMKVSNEFENDPGSANLRT